MQIERLSDREWEFLEPIIFTNRSARGRPPQQHRNILDGIIWISHFNTPWRDLPESFGRWNTVYRQFGRWCDIGLWGAILAEIKKTSSEDDEFSELEKRIQPVATFAKSRAQDGRIAGSASRKRHLKQMLSPCAADC